MHIVAAIYVCLFILFTFLGFSSVSGMARDRAMVFNLHEHTILGEKEGVFYLQYACKGRILANYNVDSNEAKIFIDDDIDFNAVFKVGNIDARSFIQTLTSFLGGASSAWTIKDVAQEFHRRNSIKKMIQSVAASVSGYSIGIALAQLQQPSCDSLESIVFVADNLKNLESTYWIMIRNYNDKSVDADFEQLHKIITSQDFAHEIKDLPEEWRATLTERAAQHIVGKESFFGFWNFGFPIGLFLISIFVFGYMIARE